MNMDVNPYDAGLDHFIKLKKVIYIYLIYWPYSVLAWDIRTDSTVFYSYYTEFTTR